MQCGFNCATCSDIKNCLTCNPTYVVNNGYCCQPGYFAVQDVTDEGQCATCISNCAVCKDGTSCTQCAVVNNTMYTYVEGACVPPKPGTDPSQVSVQVTLKIITTLETAMLPAWQSAFAQVVAFSLNISSVRVSVTQVVAASVLVTTQISPDPVDPRSAITPSLAGTHRYVNGTIPHRWSRPLSVLSLGAGVSRPVNDMSSVLKSRHSLVAHVFVCLCCELLCSIHIGHAGAGTRIDILHGAGHEQRDDGVR